MELDVQKGAIIKDQNFKTGQRLGSSNKITENVQIINCDFSANEENGNMLELINCKNCVVSDCCFHGKKTAGLCILIDGAASENNKIDGCLFCDFTITDAYGKDFKKRFGDDEHLNAEPIRIGNSRRSACCFGTTISSCHFKKLRADVETISIKSCGNKILNNLHEDCESNITIRHGGHNIIQDNLFKGSGGIRVYGSHNEIIGNYHENNSNSDKSPLTIGNGTNEDDPNFNQNDKGQHSGEPLDNEGKRIHKDGCGHVVYARAKHNIIRDNKYVNCKVTCVTWGTGPRTIKPKDKGEKECEQNKTKDNKPYTYELKEYLPPANNEFVENKMIDDDGNENSTFVICGSPNDKEDMTKPNNKNTFRGNKLYNKAKHGDLAEEQDDTEDKPIQPLAKPRAGPQQPLKCAEGICKDDEK
jgi:Chondroitinase B